MTNETREQIELDTQARQWLGAFIHAKAEIDRWGEIAKRAREQLEAILGSAEEGLVDGQVAVRWTITESSNLDQAKLKENYPDVVAACLTTRVGRRFTLAERP